MDILHHPATTKVLGAPSDMPEPDYGALPVVERTDEFGEWSISFWKPSAEEVDVLARGGAIALHVRAKGRQHPVVGLGAVEWDVE